MIFLLIIQGSNEERASNGEGSKFSSLKRTMRLLKLFILKYYQYFHMMWSFTFWYYRFRFIIQASDFNSPLLSWLNLRLVYRQQAMTDNENSRGIALVKNALFALINNAFTNLLFFVQFVKWFYDYRENQSSYGGENDEGSSNFSNASRSIIEPPRLNEKLAQNKAYKALTQRSCVCPLCNKMRSNPCALSVSGFVFCYPCIFRYVKENKRCPLTNFPCSTKNIIRIYALSSN